MAALKIVIAGCGPAGLAAALLLCRDGHGVTIFKRFEEPRPVGSGLMIQPTGMAVLRQMALDAELLRHGARIDRLVGKAGARERTVLDVRYAALGAKAGFGVGIHRAALFEILYRAVQAAGVPLLSGRSVVGSDIDGNGRYLLFDMAYVTVLMIWWSTHLGRVVRWRR